MMKYNKIFKKYLAEGFASDEAFEYLKENWKDTSNIPLLKTVIKSMSDETLEKVANEPTIFLNSFNIIAEDIIPYVKPSIENIKSIINNKYHIKAIYLATHNIPVLDKCIEYLSNLSIDEINKLNFYPNYLIERYNNVDYKIPIHLIKFDSLLTYNKFSEYSNSELLVSMIIYINTMDYKYNKSKIPYNNLIKNIIETSHKDGINIDYFNNHVFNSLLHLDHQIFKDIINDDLKLIDTLCQFYFECNDPSSISIRNIYYLITKTTNTQIKKLLTKNLFNHNNDITDTVLDNNNIIKLDTPIYLDKLNDVINNNEVLRFIKDNKKLIDVSILTKNIMNQPKKFLLCMLQISGKGYTFNQLLFHILYHELLVEALSYYIDDNISNLLFEFKNERFINILEQSIKHNDDETKLDILQHYIKKYLKKNLYKYINQFSDESLKLILENTFIIEKMIKSILKYNDTVNISNSFITKYYNYFKLSIADKKKLIKLCGSYLPYDLINEAFTKNKIIYSMLKKTDMKYVLYISEFNDNTRQAIIYLLSDKKNFDKFEIHSYQSNAGISKRTIHSKLDEKNNVVYKIGCQEKSYTTLFKLIKLKYNNDANECNKYLEKLNKLDELKQEIDNYIELLKDGI